MQPKRRGIIPLVLGLLLMFVGAPALLIGGAAYGIKGMVKVAEEAPVYQPGSPVALTSGEPVLVLVDTGAASGTAINTTTTQPQQCTVASPAGAELTLEGNQTHFTANFDGRHWESAGTYAVPATGDYSFTCAGPAKVFTGDDVEKLGGRSIVAIVFGVLGSLAVGLLGLILTIVGIVKLVRSGRERRGGGGGGYGYGNPGPYTGAPAPGTPYGAPQQQPSYGASQQQPPYGASQQQPPYGAPPPPPAASGQTPAT